MQARGIPPSVVQNTIDVGTTSPGYDGATVYYDPVNGVKVILNPDGRWQREDGDRLMDPRIRDEILRSISSYDGQVGNLGHLVADLDAIWSTEEWDEQQRKRFRAGWEKLEEVYATATERKPRAMTPVDVERVSGVLVDLPELLPAAHDADD
jgi:hypothetical protein